METKHYKNRWFLVVNGIIAILFGLLMIIFTQEFIQGVVFYAGLLMTVGGIIFLIIAIYNHGKDKNVGMLILQSVFSIAIGLALMILQERTLELFFLFIGAWAIIVGIFQLVILVNVKQNLSNKNFILFNGLLTIALGVLMIIERNEIPVFLVKVMGVFLTLFGIVMLYLSIIIRKTARVTDGETDLPSKL